MPRSPTLKTFLVGCKRKTRLLSFFGVLFLWILLTCVYRPRNKSTSFVANLVHRCLCLPLCVSSVDLSWSFERSESWFWVSRTEWKQRAPCKHLAEAQQLSALIARTLDSSNHSKNKANSTTTPPIAPQSCLFLLAEILYFRNAAARPSQTDNVREKRNMSISFGSRHIEEERNNMQILIRLLVDQNCIVFCTAFCYQRRWPYADKDQLSCASWALDARGSLYPFKQRQVPQR